MQALRVQRRLERKERLESVEVENGLTIIIMVALLSMDIFTISDTSKSEIIVFCSMGLTTLQPCG